MFRANGWRPVATGPAIRHRPCLSLGQLLIAAEPVWPFPAGLFTEDRVQFFEALVDRAESQLARAAALQGGIADIIVCAVDFVDARSDVAAAGRVGSKASDVHVPEIKARLAVDDPFRDHLADAA